MRTAMVDRLVKFGLELRPEKTRVLRCGRYARKDSARDGHSLPGTFDFLGFTHIVTESRLRRFMLMRRTSRKKRAAKMTALREAMRRRMHEPLKKQHQWLCSVVRGHDKASREQWNEIDNVMGNRTSSL